MGGDQGIWAYGRLRRRPPQLKFFQKLFVWEPAIGPMGKTNQTVNTEFKTFGGISGARFGTICGSGSS